MGKSEQLHLGAEIVLPLDVITDKLAFLAQSGGGKTYGGSHLAELMLDVGAQVVVLDPSGVWWGLVSSADGKSPGYPIIVMGGKHGNIPLDSKAGRLVAEFICRSRASVVLDVSNWTLSQQAHFCSELADALFQLQLADPQPIHLFIEEAHTFIPQQIPAEAKEAAVMLGRMRRLVKIGRNHGIGVTMISQEPQSIDKRCLNLTAVLFAGRLMGDLERKAIERWFGDNARDKSDFKIVAELPNMDTGEFFMCSPHLLKMFKRVRTGKKKTFDSSATPKFGQRLVEPKAVATVDIEKLRTQMSEMVAQVEADDPRVLRRRIAELERELKAKPHVEVPVAKEVLVEVPVLKEDEIGRLEKARVELARTADQVGSAAALIADCLRRPFPHPPARVPPRPSVVRTPPPDRHEARVHNGATPAEGITGPMQRILDALAWMESIGVDEPEQSAVAFLAGYTIGGGAWNNPRGALRTAGLVEYASGDRLKLTDDGRRLANAPAAPLTTEELHRRVLERLPSPERKLLSVALERYPDSVENDELARAAGYEPGGGAFNNPRGRLRSLGLVEYPERGLVRARDILFLDSVRPAANGRRP